MPLDTANPDLPRIVLITDDRMLKPTLFTAWTMLRRFRGNAELHFWGNALDDWHWSMVEQVASCNANVVLRPLRLEGADLAGAKPVGTYISEATMGRLLIPKKLTGRVLYLDGDVRVVDDLSPLFSLDMQGFPLAGVRDYVVSKRLARGTPANDRNRARLEEEARCMSGADASTYFNAGVLLLDASAIAADHSLCSAMQDLDRASKWTLGDQDHLNNVFAGRVRLIDPAYNSSWSRTSRQRRYAEKLGPAPAELTYARDAIIHFHGPAKPWKKAQYDFWSPRARAVFSYRRELAAFAERYPELAF
ncbi:glycosyltransferase family 8 protein [Cereibacter johrii]|uniref:Lipopolysaccharide biosynthesis glycosyltransferase n=1 Tax=Cereibacter johrii TaxID=445629 RepID=A0ABX5J2S4_9RHOB|nr:glycosyltransferase [Cereibacter johrii]PTM75865.1 lipopolysaccharide biosynthesis glycosyltransferase [Cereibacter johrii]